MTNLEEELKDQNEKLSGEIERQKQTELLLRSEKDRIQSILKSVMQTIADGVICTDSAGKITMMNEAAKNFSGWLLEDATGEPAEKVFRLIDEATREKYEDVVKNILETGRAYEAAGSVAIVSKDGNEMRAEVSAVPLFLKNGMIDGALLVFRNYAKERKKLKKIEFLNHFDQINGRYSRRNSDNELRRLGEDKYLPFAFVVADVNGVGLTNHIFGSKYSELLLKKLANILKTECRPDDIVVKIGEAKFVIFMPSCDAKYADILIARLNKAVAQQSIRNVVFTLSVDLSLNNDIYSGIDPLLEKAQEDLCARIKTESLGVKSKIIFVVMNTLFANNATEQAHSRAVSAFSTAIAKTMNLGEREIWQTNLAALLHDIGKIGINEIILDSQGRLTADDWEAIRKHPETGCKILESAYELSDVADTVLEHHERWDGKGYPNGLRGKEISLPARIIAVADTYDDMVSERSYKRKLFKEEAIAELERNAGTQFDPDVVKAFVEQVIGGHHPT